MLKQVGIRLEEELIKQIKVRALENSSTMQEIITIALQQYLTKKQEQQPTKFYDVRLASHHIRDLNQLVISLRTQLSARKDEES